MFPSRIAFYSTQGGGASGITYVGGLTDNVIADSADTVSLTGLSLEPDDYVIVAIQSDDQIADADVDGDWPILFNSASSSPGLIVAAKFMGGTPDTEYSTVSVGDPGQVVVKAFRGVSLTVPLDVTATTASGASGMPNPPSIDPVTSDCMIVIVGGLDDDNVTATAPTNYTTDFLTIAALGGGGGDGTCMMGHRLLSGHAAEDPAVFGGGGTDGWFAVTLALRPA